MLLPPLRRLKKDDMESLGGGQRCAIETNNMKVVRGKRRRDGGEI